MDMEDWIEQLRMEPHPEGGFYKRSFDSEQLLFSENHEGERKLFTSIYFLLRSQDISRFHRLKSDEIWYFHGGSPLTVHIIDEEGKYRKEALGLDIVKGEKPQVIVKKGSIFGSTVDQEDTYTLVGCMVSPGFDFQDFELFEKSWLLEKYPQHKGIIERLANNEPM